MKFGHIELLVRDPIASRSFYEDILGFEVSEIQGEGKYVWLRSGDTTLLLRPGNGTAGLPTYQQSPTGFVLYTDDLDAAVTRLTSHGFAFSGTDGSDRCLTFTDPDGNWFQLVNPSEH